MANKSLFVPTNVYEEPVFETKTLGRKKMFGEKKEKFDDFPDINVYTSDEFYKVPENLKPYEFQKEIEKEYEEESE